MTNFTNTRKYAKIKRTIMKKRLNLSSKYYTHYIVINDEIKIYLKLEMKAITITYL